MSEPDETSRGLRAGLVAYLLWGALTIFWKRLHRFDPFELIGWRVIASAVTMAAVLTMRHRWGAFAAAARTRGTAGWLALSSLLIATNWVSYMYAVVHDRVIEAALGYFIAPLGTMAIGMAAFGERPTRAQKVAIVLTVAAVVELTASYGAVPWAALLIAASWSVYGLCKRRLRFDGVEGFAAESFVLLIPAAVVVIALSGDATSVVHSASAPQLVLVSMSGVATAVPLVLFAVAAVRVPFTILGPLQFLVPIINFALGWAVYGETLPWERLVGFAVVWLALIVVTVERLRLPTPTPAPTPAAGATAVPQPAK